MDRRLLIEAIRKYTFSFFIIPFFIIPFGRNTELLECMVTYGYAFYPYVYCRDSSNS
jgi:hypothetical protein